MDEPSADSLPCIIQAVGEGDIRAMRQLYVLSRMMLFRVCFKIVCEREAAEDMLQEVYLKVWHRAPCFSPTLGSAKAWLTTIAHNTSLDWVRARGRERRGIDRLMEKTDQNIAGSFMFGRQSEHECAMHSVSELDEVSRALIHDAFVVGLTYAELAELRDMPLGTVKSRIRRGLQRVRQNLAA